MANTHYHPYFENEDEDDTIVPLREYEDPCSDPLANVANDNTVPKFYRMDCVVFAEPLFSGYKAKRLDEATGEQQSEILTIDDNVTIQKRNGKRKKYFMNLQDSSSLMCPQRNCKKVFSSQTLLKAHIRKVHCSEKDYVCEKCGASFTAQFLLQRHLVVHDDDRMQCPVCKKMLSKRTNLSVHLRSHSDTRLYGCQICNKRFLRKSTLNVHVKSVHKNLPEDIKKITPRSSNEQENIN